MRFGPAAGENFGYLKARKFKNSVFFCPPQAKIFGRFWHIRIPPPLLGTKIFKGGVFLSGTSPPQAKILGFWTSKMSENLQKRTQKASQNHKNTVWDRILKGKTLNISTEMFST